MITLEERTELEALAARMNGTGLDALSPEDQRSIEEALSRLTEPEAPGAQTSVKAPIITRMAWWR